MSNTNPTRRNQAAWPRSAALAQPTLFQWAAYQRVCGRLLATLIYLPGAVTAEGEPRPALVIPGRRLPLAFRSMADALAAQRRMGGLA
jgi:hypothetical protein